MNMQQQGNLSTEQPKRTHKTHRRIRTEYNLNQVLTQNQQDEDVFASHELRNSGTMLCTQSPSLQSRATEQLLQQSVNSVQEKQLIVERLDDGDGNDNFQFGKNKRHVTHDLMAGVSTTTAHLLSLAKNSNKAFLGEGDSAELQSDEIELMLATGDEELLQQQLPQPNSLFQQTVALNASSSHNATQLFQIPEQQDPLDLNECRSYSSNNSCGFVRIQSNSTPRKDFENSKGSSNSNSSSHHRSKNHLKNQKQQRILVELEKQQSVTKNALVFADEQSLEEEEEVDQDRNLLSKESIQQAATQCANYIQNPNLSQQNGQISLIPNEQKLMNYHYRVSNQGQNGSDIYVINSAREHNKNSSSGSNVNRGQHQNQQNLYRNSQSQQQAIVQYSYYQMDKSAGNVTTAAAAANNAATAAATVVTPQTTPTELNNSSSSNQVFSARTKGTQSANNIPQNHSNVSASQSLSNSASKQYLEALQQKFQKFIERNKGFGQQIDSKFISKLKEQQYNKIVNKSSLQQPRPAQNNITKPEVNLKTQLQQQNTNSTRHARIKSDGSASAPYFTLHSIQVMKEILLSAGKNIKNMQNIGTSNQTNASATTAVPTMNGNTSLNANQIHVNGKPNNTSNPVASQNQLIVTATTTSSTGNNSNSDAAGVRDKEQQQLQQQQQLLQPCCGGNIKIIEALEQKVLHLEQQILLLKSRTQTLEENNQYLNTLIKFIQEERYQKSDRNPKKLNDETVKKLQNLQSLAKLNEESIGKIQSLLQGSNSNLTQQQQPIDNIKSISRLGGTQANQNSSLAPISNTTQSAVNLESCSERSQSIRNKSARTYNKKKSAVSSLLTKSQLLPAQQKIYEANEVRHYKKWH